MFRRTENYARVRKWTELWTFVSGKFLSFTFFPSLSSCSSRHPARGRNNLYSWGLFLKGTGTIYLRDFCLPFICWFDRDLIADGYEALREKKGVKFNGASTRIRTSSCIHEKSPGSLSVGDPSLFLSRRNLSINLRFWVLTSLRIPSFFLFCRISPVTSDRSQSRESKRILSTGYLEVQSEISRHVTYSMDNHDVSHRLLCRFAKSYWYKQFRLEKRTRDSE